MSNLLKANGLFQRIKRDLHATTILAPVLLGAPSYRSRRLPARRWRRRPRRKPLPPPAADDTSPTQEVIITGTQISRAGFVSPTPITSVTASDITKVGSVNIADALNQIPALKSSRHPVVGRQSLQACRRQLSRSARARLSAYPDAGGRQALRSEFARRGDQHQHAAPIDHRERRCRDRRRVGGLWFGRRFGRGQLQDRQQAGRLQGQCPGRDDRLPRQQELPGIAGLWLLLRRRPRPHPARRGICPK